MSGGQQQRVALARALAIEPRVLLLDEPLSALDAKVRLQLRQQIRSLQQRLQTTTVFVTHDQEEALSIADRVCVMRDGRIEQVDAPADLYAGGDALRGRVRRDHEPDPRRHRERGVRVLGRLLAMRGEGTTNPGSRSMCWSGPKHSRSAMLQVATAEASSPTRPSSARDARSGPRRRWAGRPGRPAERGGRHPCARRSGRVFIAAPDVLTAERRAPAAFHEAPSN